MANFKMRALPALAIAIGVLMVGCDLSPDKQAPSPTIELELRSEREEIAQLKSELTSVRQTLRQSFFDELHEAYLLVLEEAVRPSSGPFSVSLATEGLSFPSLPDSLWKELSARLTAQGKDVTGYVKAEELFWQAGGQVIHRATGRRAAIFHIMSFKWLGDERLLMTHCRTTGSLSAQGYTTVLEKDEQGWRIVDRINTFLANNPAPGKAGITPALAIGHHCPGVPEPGRWTLSA
ncbi:MAG: hypothetical protein IH628_17890 [Proteobacteria bacterium]|nr:hypothetical protein [Pseudomonadota bacterium]